MTCWTLLWATEAWAHDLLENNLEVPKIEIMRTAIIIPGQNIKWLTANYADNSNFWKKFHHRVHKGSDDETWRIISSSAKTQSEDKNLLIHWTKPLGRGKWGLRTWVVVKLLQSAWNKLNVGLRELMSSREWFLNLHASDDSHLSRKLRKAMTWGRFQCHAFLKE